jgi:hypothetical protein
MIDTEKDIVYDRCSEQTFENELQIRRISYGKQIGKNRQSEQNRG